MFEWKDFTRIHRAVCSGSSIAAAAAHSPQRQLAAGNTQGDQHRLTQRLIAIKKFKVDACRPSSSDHTKMDKNLVYASKLLVHTSRNLVHTGKCGSYTHHMNSPSHIGLRTHTFLYNASSTLSRCTFSPAPPQSNGRRADTCALRHWRIACLSPCQCRYRSPWPQVDYNMNFC